MKTDRLKTLKDIKKQYSFKVSNSVDITKGPIEFTDEQKEFVINVLDGILERNVEILDIMKKDVFETLRYEAIEWVKEIRSNKDNPPLLADKPEQTIGWIKYFFNITEEELE